MSSEHELILAAGQPLLYKAAVLVAALVGGLLVRNDSRAWPLPVRVRLKVLAVVGLGSLVGCALPAFLAGGTVGELTSWSWLAPKTILGGLLFGFLAIAAFKRLTGNDADTSDAFARGAVAMMLIGRLGCVAQHCCYGEVTTSAWGLDFGDGQLRVPVQAVEFVGLLLLAVMLQWLHVGDRMRGRRLFVLYTSYGLMRFGLEALRAPVSDSYLGVGFYQWLALLLAVVGVFQIAKRSRSPEKSAELKLAEESA